jgi:hypothetical protein
MPKSDPSIAAISAFVIFSVIAHVNNLEQAKFLYNVRTSSPSGRSDTSSSTEDGATANGSQVISTKLRNNRNYRVIAISTSLFPIVLKYHR